MKCKNCGNEYPSRYYFATDEICQDCFEKMDDKEKDYIVQLEYYKNMDATESRIGFGRRFGAFLLDLMITTVILVMISFFNGLYGAYSNLFSSIGSLNSITPELIEEIAIFSEAHKFDFLILNIITMMYFSLEVIVGASVGKLLMGIIIKNEDGSAGNRKNLILRFLLKQGNTVLSIISTFILAGLIGTLSFVFSVVMFFGLFMIFTSKKQTLYDRMSSTAVYYKTEEY